MPTSPLPIARLVRLAHNGKSARDRHDHVYWAWEASLRLAVAAEGADLSHVARAITTHHDVVAAVQGERNGGLTS